MSYRIISPANSFIQFGESSNVTSCNYADINLCLPVYQEDDIAFQFVVQGDTVEETDDLCDLTNSQIIVGLVENCALVFSKQFTEKPDRFRISEFQVLYNWPHGLPGFATVFAVGKCFQIGVKIAAQPIECSNCLQRIAGDCHTSVLEYGNDENFAGFNYCNSEGSDSGGSSTDCDPTFISFTNQSTLVIPYTTAMSDKYGDVPTINTWIYDPFGVLTKMSVSQSLDTYPPTELRFDFGGPATGIIKIS